MDNVFLYPYGPSEGATLLARTMGIKKIKRVNSRFNPRNKIVINWGCHGQVPSDDTTRVINNPINVGLASDKLVYFCYLWSHESPLDTPGEYLLEYTECMDEAKEWVKDGHKVVCRTIINGHEGKGIVIAETEDEVVNAPLYTKYMKKKHEYRVHVMGGRVIDIQRKAKRNGVPPHPIRNTANGYVFSRNNIGEVPLKVYDAAITIVDALGLDFGGADVIYNEHYDTAKVVEVNTAPGIEGTTLTRYKEGFEEFINAM
jgi:glutathione synthase/RimK-type ligase-like ATP-grasp enzyme